MKEGKKRGAERTQIATRNEEWSDERLKLFLKLKPPSNVSADYNILLKAYQGMTVELFERFLKFYVDAGNDRVGIGTASPTVELDVSGSLRLHSGGLSLIHI